MSYFSINKINLVKNLRRLFTVRQNYVSSLTTTGGITKAEEKKNEIDLYEQIKNVTSPNDLFNIISTRGKLFNQKHVMSTLRVLFEIAKTNTDYVNNGNIIVHPSFENFCLILKKQSRTLPPRDIIEALKTLSILRVKGNSVICQYLLQLLRQAVNHLTVQEVMFLDFILSKFDSSPLTESLQLALPLVFQIKFMNEVDNQDVSQLTEMLTYSIKKELPQNYINTIMTCLLLDINEIDFKFAKTIIHSLYNIKSNWDETNIPFKKLYMHCLNLITTNIEKMQYQEIIRILNFVRSNIVDFNYAYNENFANAAAKYAIDNNLHFKETIQIAKQLNRMNHDHHDLIDYMSEMIVENNDLLLNATVVFNFIYVNSLSNSVYKPKSWETIQKLICQSYVNNLHRYDFPWMKFTINLASLGVYDDPLLNYIFDEDFLDHVLHIENLLDCYQLITLCSAVKTFHPSYSGNLPSQSIMTSCINSIKKRETDARMQALLEASLGPQNLAKSVLMSNGIFIDFVINFENGLATSFPDLPKQGIIKYDDLKIKDMNNAVLIMNFKEICYSTNFKRLRGNHKILVDTMEENGYNVLPISIPNWEMLKDAEKIPYIMREINTLLSINERYLAV